MLLIRTLLLGPCSDISGWERCWGSPPLDPVPMRSMGICANVLGGERKSNTGPSARCWGVQFGVREPGEHSEPKTAEPNC
jgi:hypothetical protein